MTEGREGSQIRTEDLEEIKTSFDDVNSDEKEAEAKAFKPKAAKKLITCI
jgi:hypothetical protein